nr:NAD(P)-binding domain-containing protein [Pedobacter sp. ASV2]
MSNQKRVAVIGAGPMGLAITNTFLKNGYEIMVWNRTKDKLQTLENKNVKIASDLNEAVSSSHIIIVCVLNYEIVGTLFQNLKKELLGKIIINLTNGTPKQANNAAKHFVSNGVKYIDGGIMAIPPTIGTPQSFILYSGDIVAFNEHKELLDTLGNSQFVGLDYGLASLYDLSLLSAMYGMLGGYLHAVSLVTSSEITAKEFTPVVVNWLQAMLGLLPHLSQQIDAKDYTLGGIISSVTTNVTAIANIIDTTEDQGVDTDFILPWESLLAKAVEKGNGKSDLSAIADIIKNV